MSIIEKIATARPIQTSNIFTATFNANPANPGVYDFGFGTGNVKQKLVDVFQNTSYNLARISIGGNISEADYHDAIETLPLLRIKRKISGEVVYKKPYPVNNFIDDQDFSTWFYQDKKDDELNVTLTGVLSQTASLVGKVDIKIFLSITVYALEGTNINQNLRGTLSDQAGASLMGAY